MLRVKGKKEPMAVFELRASLEAQTLPGEHADLIGGYERAFAEYQARNWDRAEALFLEVLGRFGEDGPAAAL